MRAAILLLFLLPLSTLQAQQRFALPLPPDDSLRILRNVPFTTAGDPLHLDLYRPKGSEVVPVMIFMNVGSLQYPSWPIYIGWGKATAQAGMAGVIYQARIPSAAADFEALIQYLRAHAPELGIDPQRIVLWSASANVRIGLPTAMDASRPYVRGAVVYYGDAEVSRFRTDLPLLFVRAGLDTPELNARIDSLLARALAANAPWTIENYGGGLHGFEMLNDTDHSRMIIRRTLEFARAVTQPEAQRLFAESAADADLGAAFARGDWDRAVEGYGAVIARNAADGEAHRRLGIALMRKGDHASALTALERAWALGRGGPRDTALPAAEAAAQAGNVDRSLHWLSILLSSPFAPSPDELRANPAFHGVRENPEYRRLLEEVELQRRVSALLLESSPEGLRILRQTRSGRLAQEGVMNALGYQVLARGRVSEAVEIFRLVAERYPSSANAWDSLGEALEKAGRTAESRQASQRALAAAESEPGLAPAAREAIVKASRERLARLPRP